MKLKNKAFTLTELLIALGIIGTIAAISVPSLVSNINNRILTTQLKNITSSIQELATSQMLSHRVKSLEDTDFINPGKLLSINNFETIGNCSNNNCWGEEYTSIADNNAKMTFGGGVQLKNGGSIQYTTINSTKNTGDEVMGKFTIDVNGADHPNKVGRDLFEVNITYNGKLIGTGNDVNCKNGSGLACYNTILENGWKMEY